MEDGYDGGEGRKEGVRARWRALDAFRGMIYTHSSFALHLSLDLSFDLSLDLSLDLSRCRSINPLTLSSGHTPSWPSTFYSLHPLGDAVVLESRIFITQIPAGKTRLRS